MKTIINSLGEEIVITDDCYFVTATDKFLSGWGRADGKTAKRVIVCQTWRQAQRMADAMRNDRKCGMIYINISCRMPRYSDKKYVVSWSKYEDFNNDRWMKYTDIPE